MVIRPDIMKIRENKNNLPPPPPLFDKQNLIDRLNQKLVESKGNGNSIIVKDIKNPRRTWISYEYHVDVSYTLNDNLRAKVLIPNGYYDDNSYELSFEEQLLKRLLLVQQSNITE